jgi:hypothetical protein
MSTNLPGPTTTTPIGSGFGRAASRRGSTNAPQSVRELQGEVVNADEYGINLDWTSEALDLDYLSDADDDENGDAAQP